MENGREWRVGKEELEEDFEVCGHSITLSGEYSGFIDLDASRDRCRLDSRSLRLLRWSGSTRAGAQCWTR